MSVVNYVQVDGEEAPPAAYFLNHWGTCAKGKDCLCLKPGHPWLGVLCESWKSNGWTRFEEMKLDLG